MPIRENKNQNNTWYITGHAQLPSDIPAYQLFKTVVIGLEVEPETGLITRAYCTLATPVARNIIASIIKGHNIPQDETLIIKEIDERYHGTSKKAVIYAFREAVKEYLTLKKENNS